MQPLQETTEETPLCISSDRYSAVLDAIANQKNRATHHTPRPTFEPLLGGFDNRNCVSALLLTVGLLAGMISTDSSEYCVDVLLAACVARVGTDVVRL